MLYDYLFNTIIHSVNYQGIAINYVSQSLDFFFKYFQFHFIFFLEQKI